MPLRLPRLAGAFIIGLCLALASLPAAAAERSWIKVQYRLDPPPALIANLENCLDTVADLLSDYRIYLPQPMTVVVTADPEGYIQALVSYGFTRQDAEKRAQYTAAVSLGSRPVIVIKGSEALVKNKQEVYRVLPHEIFHQVQRQWARLNTVTWMVEGAPELFRIKATERAGIAPAAVLLALEQQRVRHAKMIPSAHEIGSQDYTVFSGLAAKGYPVYPMSTVMLGKLADDAGFDKVVYFYQQLHHGVSPDKAFESVFRVPMKWFLTDMDRYFSELRATS
jgi:hypothetical protein